MADGERKRLVWTIKKDLLTLSADQLFQIAKSLSPVPEMDQSQLKQGDEEVCFEYIRSFMHSKALLDSEDSGLAHLLELRDIVDVATRLCVSESQMCVANGDVSRVSHVSQVNPQVDGDRNQSNVDVSRFDTNDSEVIEVDIANARHSSISGGVKAHDAEMQKMLASYEELTKKIMQYQLGYTQQPTPHSTAKPQSTSQHRDSPSTEHVAEDITPSTFDKMVSLRELSYLHRREFKIQGGQIADQGSDISYSNICRQIEEGGKEQFSDSEIVRAVLRVIKPGNFKDMLMTKEDLTVEELKGFLHSHLGERNNMELFQELMCTKQKDTETPQQFLYRVIGLKQKVLLASKHADTEVKYSVNTVQDVFLHTVYQGLGHKYDDIRRELKPLLTDAGVTDEAILKQMKKVMSDESERQRRLGPITRQRPTIVHSAQSEMSSTQSSTVKEENASKKPKADTIQQLTEKVEKLTNLVELMQQSIQTQKIEQLSNSKKGRTENRRERPYGCKQCVEQQRPDCSHCFHCGEEGHRAVGCLKKPTLQGNWNRSLPGDRQ